MLAAGTVVTGTGPLAGTVIDSSGRRTTVPRFGFPLQDVTQLHADIGWFTGAVAIALVIGLRLTGAPAVAVRASQIVLAGLGAQGAIGYAQYFSHLPAGLVWLHVATSAAVWILVLRCTYPPASASRCQPRRMLRPHGPGGCNPGPLQETRRLSVQLSGGKQWCRKSPRSS